MPLPALPLLDDFQRPDEIPISDGGNWTSWGTLPPMDLVSHVCRADDIHTTNFSRWVPAFASDQVAAGDMAQISQSGGFGGDFYLATNADTIGSAAYQVHLAVGPPPGQAIAFAFINRLSDHPWVKQCSGTFLPASWQVGDGLALFSNGRSIEVYYRRTGAWIFIDSADDATLSGGAPKLTGPSVMIGGNNGGTTNPPLGWSAFYGGSGGFLGRLPLLGVG